MSDLVGRLREHAKMAWLVKYKDHPCWEAADTIERLTKERDDFNRGFTIEWTRAREALNRAEKAEAELAKAREVLRWLDRKGGLGLDVHLRITAVLPATPEPQT
jgi:hypothetical protein